MSNSGEQGYVATHDTALPRTVFSRPAKKLFPHYRQLTSPWLRNPSEASSARVDIHVVFPLNICVTRCTPEAQPLFVQGWSRVVLHGAPWVTVTPRRAWLKHRCSKNAPTTIHLYTFVQITLPQNRKNLFRLKVEWLYQFVEWIFTYLQIVFFWLLVVLTSFSPCKIFESSHRWGPWRGAKGAPPKLLWCNWWWWWKKHIQTAKPAMIGLGLAFQGLGSCLGNYLARFLSAIMDVKESKENERCNLKTPRTSQPWTVCNWCVFFFVVSEHDTWSHDLVPGSENMPFSTENCERERDVAKRWSRCK